MRTKTLELKSFAKAEAKAKLWDAFDQMVFAIPAAEIERNREQICVVAEYLGYPEGVLQDLCDFGYVSMKEEEDMVADMLRAEEELTYGN